MSRILCHILIIALPAAIYGADDWPKVVLWDRAGKEVMLNPARESRVIALEMAQGYLTIHLQTGENTAVLWWIAFRDRRSDLTGRYEVDGNRPVVRRRCLDEINRRGQSNSP